MTEAEKIQMLDRQSEIASSLDNRRTFTQVPVQNNSDPATDIPVQQENLAFATDLRQARIEAMTQDLAERRKVISLVKKFGSFDNLVASTLKLEGVIEGMQESFQHAPAPAPPQHQESEGQ